MGKFKKNFLVWLVIGFILASFYNSFIRINKNVQIQDIAFSEFLNELEKGNILDVNIKGDLINGNMLDGKKFKTYAPYDPSLVEKLSKQNVTINVEPVNNNKSSFFSIILSWFPMLLLVGVWIYFMRQMQSGSGKALGFGKSKAKMLTEKTGKITFKDVAGIDESKQELEEIIEFLRDPGKFQKLGGRIPKGVLLVGPPGCGKTLLARAIAGEADVPFFTISGSDFVEMFVGVGASRVRDMFEQGKKNAPCIIFIDEIDAVGRHRGAGLGGGNDEREQTLNQLLVEMDGFESNEGVIIIAATNRPDVLDPALLRPGRFDRQVVVPNPDILGREQILKVHLRKISQSPNVDPKIIARGTPGFSGADLANLVNEAALLAARKDKRYVTMQEMEDAKDKVLMGTERKSMLLTNEVKKLTAYHESGHAIVALHLKDSDPIHKATIIPRGLSLGLVMRLPEHDKITLTKAEIEADLAVAMGGRISEELIFGSSKITTGAQSDISMATNYAKKMVTEWGMSNKLGPIAYGENEQEIFLGHSVTQKKSVSENTAQEIDKEVKRIIIESQKKARLIIKKNIKQLHRLAKGLLKHETLNREEINDIIKGKKIKKELVSTKSKKYPIRTSVPDASPRKKGPTTLPEPGLESK
ncbi:MAG: ATP-dependent zinc metalloprotease FtsH [Alphaproteobacteria bacterium MarineAlpha6_Bin2]|nr:MAG: ATP-dependent zinc metalloprotease FtsH [Alphaproteobacteria bacterium MarineAlpha6_Bin2]